MKNRFYYSQTAWLVSIGQNIKSFIFLAGVKQIETQSLFMEFDIATSGTNVQVVDGIDHLNFLFIDFRLSIRLRYQEAECGEILYTFLLFWFYFYHLELFSLYHAHSQQFRNYLDLETYMY
jgi:hypothetical protein